MCKENYFLNEENIFIEGFFIAFFLGNLEDGMFCLFKRRNYFTSSVSSRNKGGGDDNLEGNWGVVLV